MSVIYKDQQTIENITASVRMNRDLRTAVLYSTVFKRAKEFNFGKETDDQIIDATIERLFWYMWVSNKVAFQLQYQKEKVNIVEFDEKIKANEHYSQEELLGELQSLEYNIVTNDGNRFVADEWIDLFDRIVSKLKDQIIEIQASNLEAYRKNVTA